MTRVSYEATITSKVERRELNHFQCYRTIALLMRSHEDYEGENSVNCFVLKSNEL